MARGAVVGVDQTLVMAQLAGVAGLGVQGGMRNLLVPGFLGGFTTFSAFSLETTLLWERSPLVAAVYAAVSVGLGAAACALGFWLFRR